jgi:hypothetical protein
MKLQKRHRMVRLLKETANCVPVNEITYKYRITDR